MVKFVSCVLDRVVYSEIRNNYVHNFMFLLFDSSKGLVRVCRVAYVLSLSGSLFEQPIPKCFHETIIDILDDSICTEFCIRVSVFLLLPFSRLLINNFFLSFLVVLRTKFNCIAKSAANHFGV